MKEVACECVDLPEIVELPETCLLARVARALGQRDAQLLRLPLDRLERRDLLDERDEFEHIAARVAAEAVEETVGGHDGE